MHPETWCICSHTRQYTTSHSVAGANRKSNYKSSNESCVYPSIVVVLVWWWFGLTIRTHRTLAHTGLARSGYGPTPPNNWKMQYHFIVIFPLRAEYVFGALRFFLPRRLCCFLFNIYASLHTSIYSSTSFHFIIYAVAVHRRRVLINTQLKTMSESREEREIKGRDREREKHFLLSFVLN